MKYEPNPLIDTVLPLLGIGGSIAVVIALSWGNIQRQMDKTAAIRSRVDAIEDGQRAAQLESQRVEEEEKLASQRVRSNCIWVDAGNLKQKVKAGVTLLDPATRQPLQPNDVVCDLSGNTALIGADGAVDANTIARTRKAVPWQYHTSTWFKRGGQQ